MVQDKSRESPHAVLVRVLWLTFQMTKKAPLQDTFASSASHRFCGPNLTAAIADSLFSVLLSDIKSVVDNLVTPEKIVFFRPVVNPAAWLSLFASLKASDLELRGKF